MEPMRGEYLLDLAISNQPGFQVKVLPTIADHKCVLASVPMKVPEAQRITRWGWSYKNARWQALKAAIRAQDWHLDVGVEKFLCILLCLCRQYIPMKRFDDVKGAHPWLNARCKQAIAANMLRRVASCTK